MSTYNASLLMDLILTNATILASVDAYGADKAIFEDVVLPADFTGNKSILVYLVRPGDMMLGHDEFRYSASCRAATYGESLSIANTLITQLNRYLKSQKAVKMTMLPTISPANITDNYNTPVEIYFISNQ